MHRDSIASTATFHTAADRTAAAASMGDTSSSFNTFQSLPPSEHPSVQQLEFLNLRDAPSGSTSAPSNASTIRGLAPFSSDLPIQASSTPNPSRPTTVSDRSHPAHASFQQNLPHPERSRPSYFVDEPSTSTVRRAAGDSSDEEPPAITIQRRAGENVSGEVYDPLVDTEEFTLKERQEAINRQHPFGLPLWKPALYKKSRSVEREAEYTIHSQPSSELFISPGNVLWFLVFAWWMALVCALVSLLLLLVPGGYSKSMRGLAWYLFWPFGRFVERIGTGNDRHLRGASSDRWGEGVEEDLRAQWEALERNRPRNGGSQQTAAFFSMYGDLPTEFEEEAGGGDGDEDERGEADNRCCHFNLGGLIYYTLFYLVIWPMLLIVSGFCFFLVFTVPMAKLLFGLARHMRLSPLALRFKRGNSFPVSARGFTRRRSVNAGNVLLCTRNAAGLRYYKYTYDGINIFFINLLALVFFVLFADHILGPWSHHKLWITQPGPIFSMCLASVMPLAYFIGMAVSSISAQSSLGVGAVVNATFGSIIEVLLFAFAIMQGKKDLVEGSFIGNFLFGLLLCPGLSMLVGGIKRKEQRFNAKSAGVTSTILILSMIGVFAPSFFHEIYGSYDMNCLDCPNPATCNRCTYTQTPLYQDPVFLSKTRPFMYVCGILLPTAYMVALWFTLRTHAAHIYPEHNEPQRRLSLYRRLLSQQIVQQLIPYLSNHQQPPNPSASAQEEPRASVLVDLPSTADQSFQASELISPSQPSATLAIPAATSAEAGTQTVHKSGGGGHDAPEWSPFKSVIILLAATVLFASIAELMMKNLDGVMQNFTISEKFLGLTLFAIVPSVTELVNALAFAVYGNVSLSLEIGSAYTVQVAMIQIPALLAFSTWYNWGIIPKPDFSFELLFPRLDVIATVFSVFLLINTYVEGKSNYFKGTILTVAYLIFVWSFYFETN